MVVEVGGALAGMLLVGEEEMAEYRRASLDIALATEHQGQGLGPQAARNDGEWQDGLLMDLLADELL